MFTLVTPKFATVSTFPWNVTDHKASYSFKDGKIVAFVYRDIFVKLSNKQEKHEFSKTGEAWYAVNFDLSFESVEDARNWIDAKIDG